MYSDSFLEESIEILQRIDPKIIESIVEGLVNLREEKGRLFFLGVGGGAGHASHAVNDFRKIAKIESYTPADNVSELTARVNDEGWDTCYVNWLKGSNLSSKDALFIFSVGGGSQEKNISNNIVLALQHAQDLGSKIYGVVGRDGGFTAKTADACVIVPTINSETVTPQTESFQALIWHCIVSHPNMALSEMKWESVV